MCSPMPDIDPEDFDFPEVFCPYTDDGKCIGGCFDMKDRACIVGLPDE